MLCFFLDSPNSFVPSKSPNRHCLSIPKLVDYTSSECSSDDERLNTPQNLHASQSGSKSNARKKLMFAGEFLIHSTLNFI